MKSFPLVSTLVCSFVMKASSEEICYLPLDVMFLQDTTGSFDDDLPNVVAQIPDMLEAIKAAHPESFFGVAEFKDKPYYPLGEPDDFCYKLGDGKLSDSMDDFEWAYSGLYASGGGDLPEDSYQALINVALDPAVSWRPLAESTVPGDATYAGARLVIISTDAVPHLPGDIDKYNIYDYPDLPRNLPPNSGIISTGDVNYECKNQDYPSPDQAKAALASKNIYVAILTPNDSAITGAWKWINEDLLGQPSDFYQYISSDSSDLIEGVLNAIASVTAYLCPTTTTTEAPVTEAPATEAPITEVTEAPATEAPITEVTEAPATEAPITEVTEAPATEAPITDLTEAPATEAPITDLTEAPVTEVPTESEAITDECPPCPGPVPCCHIFRPAVVIKVNDKPQQLIIDYEK